MGLGPQPGPGGGSRWDSIGPSQPRGKWSRRPVGAPGMCPGASPGMPGRPYAHTVKRLKGKSEFDVLCKFGTWVRIQPVAPLWCDLGFVPNSRGNKAVAKLRPKGSE